MRNLKKLILPLVLLTSMQTNSKAQEKSINHAASISIKSYIENPLSSTWGNIHGIKYSLERKIDNIRPKIGFETYHKKSEIGSMTPTTDIYGLNAGIDFIFPPKKFTPYIGVELAKYEHIYKFKTEEETSTISYSSDAATMKAGLEYTINKKMKLFAEGQTQIGVTKNNSQIALNNNTFSLGIRF